MPKIESADRAKEIVVIVFNAFKDANGLHSNLYEAGFSMDFFQGHLGGVYERIGRAIGYLLNIFPREVPEQ